MKTPGELIRSADYTLAFRRFEPQPESARRLLVLLHGWDSDELQWAPLGAPIDADTLVVLPRGPRSGGENVFGWYRVIFDDGEPQAVTGEMQESVDRIVAFVGELQSHHDIAPSRTVIVGFSQGGVLAAHVCLRVPARAAGFAMVSGRLLPETERALANRTVTPTVRALIVHGRDDETLPPEHAAHAAHALQRSGIALTLRLHEAAHALTASMQAEVAEWFGDARQPWND